MFFAFASHSLQPMECIPYNYSSFLQVGTVDTSLGHNREDPVGGCVDIYNNNNPLACLESAIQGALEQRWLAL